MGGGPLTFRLRSPAACASCRGRRPGGSRRVRRRAGSRAAAEPSPGTAPPRPPRRIAERVVHIRARTGLDGDRNQRRIELDPPVVAADLALAARLDLDRLGELRARLAGDQDRVAGLAGGGLDPGREVDRVADHAEGEPPGAADRARDDRPGVHPHPDLEAAGAAAVDRPRQLHRALHRAVGVLVDPLGRAEDGQHGVADELVDVAAVAGDDRDDALEELVEPRHHLRRVGLRCGRREIAHVDEDQRDLELLSPGLEVLGDQVLGDLLVEIGAEGLAQPLALGESVDHLVEGRGELAELIRGGDRHVLVEAALADPLGGGLEVLDRPQDRARQQDGELEADREGDEQRDQHGDA